MSNTPTFHLVRHNKAPKLGKNSAGEISYAVLLDDEKAEPHIILTGNDSGGFFNKEPVPISALRHCVENAPVKMNAKVIKPAFVGSSNNNVYFMAAVLCNEKLLKKVPREGAGRGQPVSDTAHWDDWIAQVQTEADELGDALEIYSLTSETLENESEKIDDDNTSTETQTEAPAEVIPDPSESEVTPKPRKKPKAKG